ncbi:MAG: hypothetical protein EP329_07785 [Deltaproteobacteria bacterium]|nr:MAG: hypothetical protein EP329_07785 [Deltaproteobacteria bacterium]
MNSRTSWAPSLACAVACLALAAFAGCAEPESGVVDAVSDAADVGADTSLGYDVVQIEIPELDPTRTAYFFKVTAEDGEVFAIDRDVTADGPLVFLFSNPGTETDLSLSFGDAIVTVRLLLVELDFGVVLNADGPVDIPGPANYDFGPVVPTLLLGVDDSDYSSGGPGADGTIYITDWSDDRGGRIAGRIKGRLTDDDGRWIDVDGRFNLILPRAFRQSSNRPCDLLLQDCADWEACYWVDDPPAPSCRLPGTKRAGAACEVPEACAPGFICRLGFCRRLCLLSAPECNIDYTCEPWYGAAGYCAPPR